MQTRHALHAATVAVLLFSLYAATSPRSVALEDDGLFVLSGYFLGVEHPPGYPLFTWIAHLFSMLPFGSVAYRIHLASALFGALTCAMAWLCARSMTGRRLPGYVAAFALGLSPVFWSQAIIAEVYTLNTFFFLLLVYLGLRAEARLLPWMAFVFGLSLSNHWPLMLLAAPAFAVLLWPLRAELARRAPLLIGLVALGLVPYLWMIIRSLMPIPINFLGPLESLRDVWYFVSRAGYADVDHSPSAGWLDRVKFFRFFGAQVLLQFALLGTLVAAAGFAAQWRRLGRRTGAFLTIAFLMPSVVLLLLLGFDYSSLTAHVFHVYPLPAYAVAALWVALGFDWVVERHALRPHAAGMAAVSLGALIFAVGARTNIFADHEWGARYARTVLSLVPQNAVVMVRDEADLGPIGYFHLIEDQRPDITLYQTKGLVLGNRLFKPNAVDETTRQRILRETIERQTDPVVLTLDVFDGYAFIDRWLYISVDKSSREASKVTIDVPEPAVEFFERHVAVPDHPNAWVAFFQAQLRRRYGEVLAQRLPRGAKPDERTQRHLDLLSRDYYGALGIAEGLIRHPQGFSAGEVARYLDKARAIMPSDVVKDELARYFHLRAAVRAALGDEAGAVKDFETALSVWPASDNPAIKPLEELYRKAGNAAGLQSLQAMVKRPLRLGR